MTDKFHHNITLVVTILLLLALAISIRVCEPALAKEISCVKSQQK